MSRLSLAFSDRFSGKAWYCKWLDVGSHGVSNGLLCDGDHVHLCLHTSYQVYASFGLELLT